VPESGVFLIAGANNVGKSALLSAMDVLATGSMVAETAHYGSAEPVSITATFTLDDAELARLWQEASGLRAQHRDAFREIRFEFRDPGQAFGSRIAPVRVATTWPPHGEVVLAEYVARGGSGMVRRNDAEVILAGSLEPRPTFSLRDGGGGTLDGTALRGYAPQMGAFEPLMSFLSSWASGIYHFKALRPGTPGDSHRIRGAARLEPTGQNLPDVLTYLYHNQRVTYEALNRLLQQIVPDVGELELPLNGDETRITFRDPATPTHILNLKSLGTGVEQLLMTLVVGLTGGGPSGVIIEEPETNLHPGAQRALLALIREWSIDRPYIMATHSPVLLDTSHRAEVVLVTRHAGASQVRSLGSNALDALDELGVRLSDVLSADRLLLVEGPTDAAILRVWFPEMLANQRVAVIPAVGGDNARYARHLQAWLSEADRLGDRRVLFLRDRDELPEAEVKSLETGGFVRVPLRREIENYLLDEAAVAQFINNQRKAARASSDEVRRVMREVADGLKQTVVLKRVCRRLTPIRLMDHDLRNDLARQGAGLGDLQVAIATRAQSPDDVKAAAASLWREADHQVTEAWEHSWRALAPGQEVLTGIMTRFGLAFSKAADGPQIAAAMSAVPEELQTILHDFIGS
jgi:hypothetical protein